MDVSEIFPRVSGLFNVGRDRDKNFGNFGRFFAEISSFGAGGKEIQVEKSFEKKSWKIAKNRRFFGEKSEKSDFFSEKIRFFPKFRVNYSLGH